MGQHAHIELFHATSVWIWLSQTKRKHAFVCRWQHSYEGEGGGKGQKGRQTSLPSAFRMRLCARGGAPVDMRPTLRCVTPSASCFLITCSHSLSCSVPLPKVSLQHIARSSNGSANHHYGRICVHPDAGTSRSPCAANTISL